MTLRILQIALVSVLITAASASAKLRIVSSTTDLGSIASTVGGDQVEVMAIARPNADPHRVEVLPSYMVRVSRADLYLKVGLGLDQWADPIIDGSHNSKLKIVDCSNGVEVLERPTGKVDASMGDVHPYGNSHYWLDPANGAIVARTIANALADLDPGRAADYAARAEEFGKATEAMTEKVSRTAADLPSKSILTYHRSWSYMAHAFGLEVVDTVEPIPGIPPTGRHLQDLVNVIRQRKVRLLIQEPYFADDAGKFLNREIGIRVAVISAACDDVSAGSYLAHFDTLAGILAQSSASSAPARP
jgi:zinc/manganese transport system substrate-binding protein